MKHLERDGKYFRLTTRSDKQPESTEAISAEVFASPLRSVIDDFVRLGFFNNLQQVGRVAVRIVAPGTLFQKHQIIDEFYVHELRKREASAPLHVPVALKEIMSIQTELPQSLLVGVSDSAFHSTMPSPARLYSIERKDTADFDLYRFGYHGLSVGSVAERIHAVSGIEPARAIVVHVGGGVSVTALDHLKSVETTMGFSPSSGLMMGSRAGDLEPGALLELMRVKNMGPFDTHTYINSRGGLFGVGGDSDLRHILEGAARGDVPQTEALALFVHHIKKAIGSYVAILGGLDAIVLTATAPERNPTVRSKLLSGLEHLGIKLDTDKNESLIGKEGVISTHDSPAKVVVIKTNEMGELARLAESIKSPVV